MAIQYLPRKFRDKHRTSFPVLFIIVSLFLECTQQSARNVNKIASVHQRECDWCTNIKSQCFLGACQMCYNVYNILKHFWSCLKQNTNTESTEYNQFVHTTYFQNIKYILFCLFLASWNLSVWARFCESYWDTILQFLRALLLMACNKPHKIFPLGEGRSCKLSRILSFTWFGAWRSLV